MPQKSEINCQLRPPNVSRWDMSGSVSRTFWGAWMIISSPQAPEWSLGSSEIKSLLFSLKTIEFASLYMIRLQIPMNYLWRSCWICGTTLAIASKGSKPSVGKFLWKMDHYCSYFHRICHSVMLGECWVGRLDVCVGYFTSGNYWLCIRRLCIRMDTSDKEIHLRSPNSTL